MRSECGAPTSQASKASRQPGILSIGVLDHDVGVVTLMNSFGVVPGRHCGSLRRRPDLVLLADASLVLALVGPLVTARPVVLLRDLDDVDDSPAHGDGDTQVTGRGNLQVSSSSR